MPLTHRYITEYCTYIFLDQKEPTEEPKEGSKPLTSILSNVVAKAKTAMTQPEHQDTVIEVKPAKVWLKT